MFCKKCGKELFDEAVVCPNCGCATNNYSATQTFSKSGKFTAAKIFIIIGMVVSFFLIIPIIVGVLSLIQLSTAKQKSDITIMGVLTLLFCSLIGGIIMLCITDKDFGRKENVLY